MKPLNNEGEHPIHAAVRRYEPNRNALKVFLDMGMDPNSKGPDGKPLLTRALVCLPEVLPVVQLLLNYKAIPYGPDGINLMDFVRSMNGGEPELCEQLLPLLLEHGAKFDGYEAEYFTFAAVLGYLGVMKVIFQSGGDINTPSIIFGRLQTPIRVAIFRESTEMLQFLVERGVKMFPLEKVEVERVLGRKLGALTSGCCITVSSLFCPSR